MKTGFAHFDDHHRENFLAAILLLVMDVDPQARARIASLVRELLAPRVASEDALVEWGREWRLKQGDDADGYARADIVLRFRDAGCVLVEVKTHVGWNEQEVVDQVLDQQARPLAKADHPRAGHLLLAPARLADRVRRRSSTLPVVSWRDLLSILKGLVAASPVTEHAIRHLEENIVERRPGSSDISAASFVAATSTIACLRDFLLDCIEAIGGVPRKNQLYTTSADGRPREVGDWAWHGVAVPFDIDGRPARLGVYEIVTSPGEEVTSGRWLNAFIGNEPMPALAVPFTLESLTADALDDVRDRLVKGWEWSQRRREQPPTEWSLRGVTYAEDATHDD